MAAQPTPDETGIAEIRHHVVQQGDTLSAIALREYGSTQHGTLIYEANRDQLASMDDLQIGMELVLPSRP